MNYQTIANGINTFHSILSLYLAIGWMIPSKTNSNFLTLFIPTIYVNWLIDDHTCLFTKIEDYFRNEKKIEDKPDGFINKKLVSLNINVSEKNIDRILTFITYHTFLQCYMASTF